MPETTPDYNQGGSTADDDDDASALSSTSPSWSSTATRSDFFRTAVGVAAVVVATSAAGNFVSATRQAFC